MKRSDIELKRLSEVISLIYEGATDPSRWTRDIVPATAEYLRVPGAFLFTASHRIDQGGFAFYQGLSQDRADLFMSQYLHNIPWVAPAAQRGLIRAGNVIMGDELLSKEQWLSSKLFVDCFARARTMEQMMTGIVFGMEAQDTMGTVYATYRSLDDPAFADSDRDRMQLLLPHISRSIGVMQRLRAAELTVATTLAALDRLPSGVLLLDASGHVAFANRSAQQMLAQGDGLRLCPQAGTSSLGRLDTAGVSAQRLIDAAIQATLRRDPYDTPHFSKSVLVPRPSGWGNYALQFSALGNHNEFGGGASGYSAIVFIADSAQKPIIDPVILRTTYGLTPTEAVVAITLLEHDSAKEAARVLGTSPHTVRSQLQQIYAKLGVDTRTRFVKVMLGLASQAP